MNPYDLAGAIGISFACIMLLVWMLNIDSQR